MWGLWPSTPTSWNFSVTGFAVRYFSSLVLATGRSLNPETSGCQYWEIFWNYFFDHFLPFIFFLLSPLPPFLKSWTYPLCFLFLLLLSISLSSVFFLFFFFLGDFLNFSSNSSIFLKYFNNGKFHTYTKEDTRIINPVYSIPSFNNYRHMTNLVSCVPTQAQCPPPLPLT